MYKPPYVGYIGPVTHSTYRTYEVYWLEVKKRSEICKILIQIIYQEACAMFPPHFPRLPTV